MYKPETVKIHRLEKLCKRNGRYFDIVIHFDKDYRSFYTADFDGCDMHYSETIDEAIKWEEGYKRG